MKPKAQKIPKALQAEQQAIKKKAEAVKQKQELAAKEEQELIDMQRASLMKNTKSFGFDEHELNAFVSGLDGVKNKKDIAIAVINAAQTAGKADVNQIQLKLMRLGFI